MIDAVLTLESVAFSNTYQFDKREPNLDWRVEQSMNLETDTVYWLIWWF